MDIVIAQAPMDGVTDAAFRYIIDTIGHPDLLITEFVPVEGIRFGRAEILRPFIHHATKTPTIAQIYGTDIEAFSMAAVVALEMRFDGIDINMGCPDKSVSGRGAGAGLIRTPELAAKIIQAVRRGIQNWHSGMTYRDVALRTRMEDAVAQFIHQNPIPIDRNKRKSLSVKTRLGCDCPVVNAWIGILGELELDWITLHGRTLSQMYTGKADWDQIALAKQILVNTSTKLYGNGDIQSRQDALDKCKTFGVDGVLIGRAGFGNPWVFSGVVPTIKERLTVALSHCEAYGRLIPDGYFPSLRKHLAWYCRGFDGSAKMRAALMTVENMSQVRSIIEPVLSHVE